MGLDFGKSKRNLTLFNFFIFLKSVDHKLKYVIHLQQSDRDL